MKLKKIIYNPTESVRNGEIGEGGERETETETQIDREGEGPRLTERERN